MKNQIAEIMTIQEFKQLIENQLSRPIYFLSRNKQDKSIIDSILKQMKKG